MRFPRAFFRWRLSCRENDVRLSLRAAVVRDGSAAELLENDNEVYALSELLDRSAQDGVLPNMPLYRVTDVLHADGTVHSSGLARGCVRDRRHLQARQCSKTNG